jgi:ornithine cyclodeaminase
MRWLTADDIRKLIDMDQVIQLMREVFAAWAENMIVMPERIAMEMENRVDSFLFMPAYLPSVPASGIKIVGIFPGNPSLGLPTLTGKVVLNDPKTGHVACILDASVITALRTAAVSAVSADLLALPDVATLGIFGAGIQGESHARAMMAVRPLREIILYDTRKDKARKLAEHLQEQYGKSCAVTVAEHPRDAVIRSRIVVTVTTSKEPVFNGQDLLPGTHVVAVGSFKPHIREVDDITMQRARIFVDVLDLALAEAGDLIIPLEKGVIRKESIQGDLGDLILGRARGRTSDAEITFFKSVGMAAEDIRVADHLWREAESKNIGSVI